MLYLVTGQIGASKTLNTIKMVNEDPAFQNRPVYYFNIKDLSPRFGWTELSLDEALEWYKLPPGSVIILDEAYKVFPNRSPQSKVPLAVEKLAELRHDAYEVILICQKVKGQLDSFIRGLVNYHYHYVRKFGSEYSNRFFWEKCQENIDGFHEKREAQTKMIKFDKKYYGAYRSAEAHTVEQRLPIARLVGFAVAVVGVFVFGYWAVATVAGIGGTPESEVAQQVNQVNTVPAAPADTGFQNASFRTGEVTTEDWYQARQARVPGFAHTAPIYDEVTKPVTFPRPNCIVFDTEQREGASECRCYSQQATRMDVPPDICLSIVKNGWFDSTIPDNDVEATMAMNRGSVPDNRQVYTQPRYYSAPPPSTLIGEGSHLITASNK